MALTMKRSAAPTGDGKFELTPAGNHLCVLYGVVDLGTQDHPWAQEQDKRWFREVRLIWETSEEKMADGRPFSIGEKYRLSLNEKANLFKVIKGVLGREIAVDEEFDLKSLIGLPCMVSIVHNAEKNPKPGQTPKVYANVDTVSRLSKRDAANPPEQINDDLYYDIDMGPPGPSVPEWLRKKIMEAKEFAGHQSGPNLPPVNTNRAPGSDDDGSDIPF